MVAVEKAKISVEEYLAGELTSDVRHELVDGEVYAMVGSLKSHSMAIFALQSKIHNHLKGAKCNVFASDIKVNVADNYYYPDLVVDCAEDDVFQERIAGEPILIIEVLSPSTRAYDLGHKLKQYQQIETLQEYVIVDVTKEGATVGVFSRGNNWLMRQYSFGDDVMLACIDLSIPVSLLYDELGIEQPKR